MNEEITNIAIILINLLGKSQKSNFFYPTFLFQMREENEKYINESNKIILKMEKDTLVWFK